MNGNNTLKENAEVVENDEAAVLVKHSSAGGD